MDMLLERESKRCGDVEPVGMGFRMRCDFFENGFCGRLRLPVPDSRGFGVVENDPRNIEWPRRAIDRDRMGAEARVAPISELAK